MNESLLKDRLRELRINMHFTQKYVGQYLNMTRQGYAHYEAGLRTPDYLTLIKISKLYQVNLNDLINSNTGESNCETLYENGNYNTRTNYQKQAPSTNDNQLTTEEREFLNLFKQLSICDKKNLFEVLMKKVYEINSKRKI